MPSVTGTISVEQVKHLADNLRDADKEELGAMSGRCPFGALLKGAHLSQHSRLILGDDGTPLAIYGKVPVPNMAPEVTSPWLMASNDIHKYRVWMLRGFKPFIDECQGHDTWIGLVYHKNTLHIDWLRWHGFLLGEGVRAGISNDYFLPFRRMTPNV